MKNLKTLVLFLLCSTFINAQVELEREIVASGGGTASASGTLDLSYTVGDVATMTFENAEVVVCLGFQQSDENITSVSFPDLAFDLSVFPNPATDYVSISAPSNETFTVQLIDVSGKILQTQLLFLSETPTGLSLTDLPAGLYVLRFSNENHTPFSFKLQKTK